MKTKSVWTNVGEVEEEEKEISLMTNPRSTTTSLDRFAPELVVMVASHLDVSSYLALAFSSNVLLHILTSQVQWKALLQKTKMSTRSRSRTSCMKTLLDYTPGVSSEAWAAMWDFESQSGRTDEDEATDEIHQSF